MSRMTIWGILASVMVLLYLPCQAAPNLQRGEKHQTVLNSEVNATFRDMIESDLGDVVTIVIEAFSTSATWSYTIPGLAKHKDEIWHCLHEQVLQQWQEFNRSTVFCKVITVPVSDHATETQDRAVALAIWNINTREDAPISQQHGTFDFGRFSTSKCDPLPGVNYTRVKDLDRQLENVTRKYFDDAYEKQLYLSLLATHPEWDGNGFAARHCHWGMKVAQDLEVPLTLFATPAGWPLYDSLGFESVKNVTTTMLDGLGMLWDEVMRWNY